MHQVKNQKQIPDKLYFFLLYNCPLFKDTTKLALLLKQLRFVKKSVITFGVTLNSSKYSIRAIKMIFTLKIKKEINQYTYILLYTQMKQ